MKKTMMLAVCLILAGLLAVNGTFAFDVTKVVDGLFATLSDWLTGEAADPYEGGGFDVNLVYVDANGNILTNVAPPQLLPGGTVERRIAVRNSSTSTNGEAPAAYFRIAFAVQTEIAEQLTFTVNNTNYEWKELSAPIQIDGANYQLLVATYRESLPAGQTAPAAMQSVTMSADTTSEQIAGLASSWMQVQVLAVDATSFAGVTPDDDPALAKTVLDKALSIDAPGFNPFK